MTASDLLDALRQRGFRLAVLGDRIVIDAPAGAITPEIRAEILDHKPDLLRRLAEPPTEPTEPTEPPAADLLSALTADLVEIEPGVWVAPGYEDFDFDNAVSAEAIREAEAFFAVHARTLGKGRS